MVKPASKTSFSSTEIRGTYAPPFHVSVSSLVSGQVWLRRWNSAFAHQYHMVGILMQVEVFRNDQHRVKIVIDSENEVDLMVQSRHIRDVIVLVVRGLAQRFNSTPLNLLLKM